MSKTGLSVRILATILVGFAYLKMWDAIVDVGRLVEIILQPYDILLESLLRFVQAISINFGLDIHDIAVFFVFTVGSFLLAFYGTVKEQVGLRALGFSALHTAIFFGFGALPERLGLPTWSNVIILLAPYLLVATVPPIRASFAYPEQLWRRFAGGIGLLIAAFAGFIFVFQVSWLQGISRFPDIVVCGSASGVTIDCSEASWNSTFELTLALDANRWMASTTMLILVVLAWCLAMLASHKARLSRLAINLMLPFILATTLVGVSRLIMP
ncbi:MAG: hypothetical protein NXI12_13900 [Alphaproteobacteria bacterium]|nr:hypothetical protein [Alphaproteobacteria bacterium]